MEWALQNNLSSIRLDAERRNGVRALVKFVIVSLAMALWIMVPLVAPPSVHADRVEQPVIHEGELVEITDTEVKIKEWAGTYTYRLTPGGRPALDQAGIKSGDKVIFYAWEAAQIAFDFKKK